MCIFIVIIITMKILFKARQPYICSDLLPSKEPSSSIYYDERCPPLHVLLLVV
jgi:hypothetical protein